MSSAIQTAFQSVCEHCKITNHLRVYNDFTPAGVRVNIHCANCGELRDCEEVAA